MRIAPGCLPSSRPTSSELSPPCTRSSSSSRSSALEPVERPAHGRRLVAGDGVLLRTAVGRRALLLDEDDAPLAGAGELVHDVAGDPVQPGVEAAALPREAVDVVEGSGHRLADGILGRLVVEQAAAGEPEQVPVGPAIERLPRIGVALHRSSDERPQGVARIRPEGVVGHPRTHVVSFGADRATGWSAARNPSAGSPAASGPGRRNRRSALGGRDGDVDDRDRERRRPWRPARRAGRGGTGSPRRRAW